MQAFDISSSSSEHFISIKNRCSRFLILLSQHRNKVFLQMLSFFSVVNSTQKPRHGHQLCLLLYEHHYFQALIVDRVRECVCVWFACAYTHIRTHAQIYVHTDMFITFSYIFTSVNSYRYLKNSNINPIIPIPLPQKNLYSIFSLLICILHLP